MQQETEKELNSQIKNWGKTLRNEEPVIVEESQRKSSAKGIEATSLICNRIK